MAGFGQIIAGVGQGFMQGQQAAQALRMRAQQIQQAQMQIDQQVRRGRLAALGALAGAAQSTGGWFTLDEITDVHADPTGIAQARTAAEQLAAEQILIESREDEFGRAYRFIEPSVPIYLWLLAARGQFFDLEQPERRGEPV